MTRRNGRGNDLQIRWGRPDRHPRPILDRLGRGHLDNGLRPSDAIVSRQASNTSYLWHPGAASIPYAANGLNQYTTVGAATPAYADGRANLTALSGSGPTFSFDTANDLLSASGPTAVSVAYDPAGRIQTKTSGGASETFLYAGAMLVGEYASSGTILDRYIPGAGQDEAALMYSGAGTGTPQWLHADQQGSTIAWSNGSGASLGNQAYDPYGEPQAWSGPRYAYTGQIMIAEAQLYDCKARAYDPALGRFLQTDPAASDLNPYAYVANDPVNGTDPSGGVSAQCDPPECSYVDLPAGGYIYDNGQETVGCSVGTFEGGGAVSGDCGLVGGGFGGGGGGYNFSGGGGGAIGGNGGGRGNAPPQSNGRNCSVAPASAGQYAAATAESVAMTAQFFSGLGDASPTFGPGSATSQVMGQSAGVQAALGQYQSTGATSGLYSFGLSGLGQAGANPVAQFVGSFRWSISGNTLSVTNTSSFKSLAYDHGPQWQRSQFAPMGNTHQTYNIQIGCH